MKQLHYFYALLLIAGTTNLWGPSGSGNLVQKFPFNFDVSTKEFQKYVLNQRPYLIAGPTTQFAPLFAYLYLQYRFLNEHDAFTQDDARTFLTNNQVSSTVKPRPGSTKYTIAFESSPIFGIKNPSAAVKAAAPLLGKTIYDDLRPSPVLTWLNGTRGGDKNVQNYLNLVATYLFNKENAYETDNQDSPNYLAKHLWRRVDLDARDLLNAFDFSQEDLDNLDPKLLTGTLFDIFDVPLIPEKKRLALDLRSL